MGKCELAEGCNRYLLDGVTCNIDDGKFGSETYCGILKDHKDGKKPTAIDYSKITKKRIFKYSFFTILIYPYDS